ncbi:hypothetical protein AAE250_22130 [Bacteroides sp. GD17]|jgi:outer membrane murein-binding lipoprotein Lpp|uniref:hypothetical protein n=1 Tax=Bacteroides sp. GD17 TaxID=3139826 RepID=UPI0025FC3D1F|nr:hypothetical protein [uncultured Bacteroides sp.]
MNKKFLSVILFSALMVGTAGTFTSCKDYDDDIENLDKKSSDLSTQLSTLQSALDAAKSDIAAAKSAADAAKEAAATAKSEAIQAAIDKVNEMLKDAPGQEALDKLATQITAIETGLNKINGKVDAWDNAVAQLKIQEATLKTYKGLIDANATEIGKINDAIAAINETLNATDKSVKAVEKSLAGISAQIAAINEDLVTILGKELRSIVFYPDLYTDGIESTEYPFALDVYLTSKALTAASDGNDDGATPYSIPAKQVVSYSPTTTTWEFNPVMTAWYHMNPSSAVIDSKDQLSFVSRDIESITRAAGNESAAKPAVQGFDTKTKPGMLGVQYSAIGKKISADKDLVSAMALQVDIKKAEKDTTITSDYAVLYPAKITAEAIAYSQKNIKAVNCANTDFDQVYETAQDAIKNAPTLKVEYNGSLELKDYLAIHYNRSNEALGLTDTKTAGQHKVWAYGEEAAYNLEYRYSLVEYTVGRANTEVHKYGNVNATTGHFEPRYVDNNGNSIASDGTTGISAVGKKPVVRVEVIDKTTKKVVLGGFVKILIAKTVEPIVAQPFDMGQISYVCTYAYKNLTWAQMSNQLLELAAVSSKAEFEKQYELDLRNGSWMNPETGETNDYWANIWVKEKDEFVRMDQLAKYNNDNYYYGRIEEYGNRQGVANDEIWWGLNLEDRNHIYAANDNHQVTIYLRYKPTADLNEEGGLPSIFVPLTLQVVKPAADYGKKIAEYWYDDMKTQHLNVKYPADNTNTEKYIVDLDNAFDGNLVKFTLTNNANDTHTGKPIFANDWAKAGYISYWYFFAWENDGAKIGDSGYEYDLDGTKATNPYPTTLYAKKGNVREVIATVDQTSQTALGCVRYANADAPVANDVAKLLLNAWTHDDAKNAYSPIVGIRAFNEGCDITLDDKYRFNARFQRPIDATDRKNGKFTDAEANGSTIDIANILDFEDWRNAKFIDFSKSPIDYKNAWLFAYYDVKGVTVNVTGITTTMSSGTLGTTKLVDVTKQIQFSHIDGNGNEVSYLGKKDASGLFVYNPFVSKTTFDLSAYNTAAQGTQATFNAVKKALGQIKYENNGNNVKEFKVRIPIAIEYEWGVINTSIDCDVVNTMGN